MNGAVIDLGTNTFNLIIFEKTKEKYRQLASHKISVNLGMGGINENIISDSAMDRAHAALSEFVERCNGYKVEKIKAFGTSAMRGAKNAPAFVEHIKMELGIDITIIDGQEEASLIYEGVKSVHKFDAPSCIMDIGGGSTEFILIEEGKLIRKESFDIGISRVIQKFELNDPLTEHDITKIIHFFESNTNSFFSQQKSQHLIGASGSFETYSDLIKNVEINPSRSQLLLFNALIDQLDYLIHSSSQERRHNKFIPEYREPMIHVAALKTKWVIEQLGIVQCYVSPASLKEGIIIREFGK